MTTQEFNLFAEDLGNIDPPADPTKNYLEELVGDGKKFKTAEELARGKAEADAFIERLKKEQEALRNELNTKLTLEQYIDKMAATGTTNTQTPNEPNGNQGEHLQGLKPEDVERLIDQRVSQRETERIQNENLRTVKDTLSQQLGPDFTTKLKSIGQNIGMTEEDMTNMARTRPKALLALVGAQNSQPQSQRQNTLFTAPTGNQGFRSEGQPVDRTQKYYDNLKKSNPSEYWSPSIQNQLHKDAIRLGDKFFDVG